MQELIKSTLVANGWTLLEHPSLASKTYETAIGPKTAFAYLGSNYASDPHRWLFAQYWSGGRDILEPHGVLLPKVGDTEKTRKLIEQFSAGVDKAVANSYAARLLRH